MKKALGLFVAGAILAAVPAAGTAIAEGEARAEHQPLRHAASAALASDWRITSLGSRGDSVVVTGVATDSGADTTRTLWREGVEGAAYAERHGATTLTRRVLRPSGQVLRSETDRVHTVSPAADAPLTLSEVDISRGAEERAAALHATVVAVHYVPLFGGTAELVVQPDEPASFVQTIGMTATTLLGPVGRAHGAFLITIVDSTRTPLFVLGYTPGLGGDGQGVAWEVPGVHSGVILGEPVTVSPLASAANWGK